MASAEIEPFPTHLAVEQKVAASTQDQALSLRVKDLDFAPRQIIVRDGKGLEERINLLPESLIVPLQAHVAHVKRLHAQDVAQGVDPVY
jgi:integrase